MTIVPIEGNRLGTSLAFFLIQPLCCCRVKSNGNGIIALETKPNNIAGNRTETAIRNGFRVNFSCLQLVRHLLPIVVWALEYQPTGYVSCCGFTIGNGSRDIELLFFCLTDIHGVPNLGIAILILRLCPVDGGSIFTSVTLVQVFHTPHGLHVRLVGCYTYIDVLHAIVNRHDHVT